MLFLLPLYSEISMYKLEALLTIDRDNMEVGLDMDCFNMTVSKNKNISNLFKKMDQIQFNPRYFLCIKQFLAACKTL